MLEYAWLIPVAPFLAFVLIGLLPKRTLLWEDGGGFAVAGAGVALVLSFLVIWDVINGHTLTDGSGWSSGMSASHSASSSTSSLR
jgi:NADH:ubiquinone oxidoreductase subunit 5 (subunit L)/multisubunit Na+/H+ antiporter MnhA subunit